MAQKKYTDGSGVSEIWLNIKNYVYSQLLGKADSTHTHTKSEITDFPSLATVATSGSYNDLSNKPTIPTVNNATLTIQKNGTNVATFTSNSNTNVTANITVPTKVSEFTNDSGFITSAIKEISQVDNDGGWCLLHGGLLIQYGTHADVNNDFTINFYKAFSVVPVVVANYGDNVSFNTPCAVDDIFKTAFVVKHSESGAWRVNWIAIGRA